VRPFFLDPVSGNPSPKKKIYDFLSYLVTQITFSFATTPFLTLTLRSSVKAWSALYFYGLVWTLAALAFFSSPGKVVLRKQLESRQGKANARLVRTASSESITSMEPILGISKDPEKDINEAVEQLKAEIDAKRREIAEKKKA
jgi:lysophospholipid acyltransferase